jgi:type IV pilus biogenesis protein CpaD/CtpE
MVRRRRPVAVAAVAVAVLLAGCATTPTSNESTSVQTQTISGVVLTVDEVVREERFANASTSAKVNFTELSSAKQEEFQTALDHEVTHPDAWEMGGQVEYVRYNGTWYNIQTFIAN